ncbi:MULTISPECIES: DUF4870 domain-containing protein [Heyndrickxia]|uniref:DUF4870 domain-containing protein n=1 Tax=Heyndrickxia TaxID=2837504 RepID=UPI001B293989|nr:DUF4870 domain-containing protein [Heyndrickxia oleronia]GIN40406.1 hypothetical protein J19TS1_33550 [Heyndrickxia oleronia]
MVSQEEKILAAGIYITSFFTTIIGPLIIWLIKKDDSEFINAHGKAYFNFIISYFIYSIIFGILVIVLIGFVLLWLLGIVVFVFTIIGAVKAFQGEHYKIPFTFEWIK